jgi:CheY-like chemotaxis protein
MSNKTILVVEDNADVRLGIHVLLKTHHYATLLAGDGHAALREAQQRPDLIVLDLGLPAGDGFTVLERLQAIPHLSTIPVVVVSARDVHGNKERALEAGAKAYFQKPWNDSELLATIGELLGELVA